MEPLQRLQFVPELIPSNLRGHNQVNMLGPKPAGTVSSLNCLECETCGKGSNVSVDSLVICAVGDTKVAAQNTGIGCERVLLGCY